ncbi:MAG: hypothetical protein ACK2T3_13550, partial [Candidatus Promineifilaceae bacterium]
MKEPNERDESQQYDDELKNEDEFEEGASPNESGIEQPDEPPDWLVETVGLSDQSRQSPSPEENPLDEDDSAGEDPQSSPLGGVEFPAWLSGGASQDEEDEEEDILETLVGPAASLESITQDAEPTGDASAQASTTAEKALGALLDETPDEQDQEPAEFEDELKWLEEIAASHEASDDAPFGSEFDENTMVPFPENEYLPDWLKDSATSDVADFEEHPEPASFDETPEPANVVSETPERADDEFLDWLSDPGVDERSSTSVESSEDIDWFNQIVSGDESAIDQLLASQGIDLDSVQESSSAVQDDDEPSWLEAMDDIPASIDETIVGKTYIVDEVRAIPPVELEEEFIPDEFAAEEFAPDADQEEVPTDPEEAMAWLEQLAQEENEGDEFIEKTLESEVEFEYEMDSEEPLSIASSTPAAIPDDPDEAMAWLEQLASEE